MPEALEGRGEVVFAFTAEEETGGKGLGTVLPSSGPWTRPWWASRPG